MTYRAPSPSIGHPDRGNVVNLHAYRRKVQAPPLAPAMSIEEAMVAAKLAKLPPGRPSETVQISTVSQTHAADQ